MRCIFFLVSLFLTNLVLGQADTTFWFAVPEVTQRHEDRPVFFRLTTFGQPAEVSISLPAQGIDLTTVSIAANDVYSFRITDPEFLENDDLNTINDKGVLIQSNVPITAYYEIEALGFNTDIYALKGQYALGKSFVVPFQTVHQNVRFFSAHNSVQIVATEDETMVTIIPSVNNQDPVSVTLNKGETYAFASLDESSASRLSGSQISSDKPIAVSITDDSVEEGINYDLVSDQLIPMSIAGTLYALPAGLITFASTSDAIITAGTETFTLNESNDRVFSTVINTPVLASSTEPIIVNYLDGISNARGTEFGGAILPPLSCSGSREVAFTRSNITQDFFTYLVFRTSSINDFKLNGNDFDIPQAETTQLDDNLSYVKLEADDAEIPRGNHRISNTSAPFHLAIGGGSIITGYQLGYFSNYRTQIPDTLLLCNIINTPEDFLNELNLFGEITLDTLDFKNDSVQVEITVTDEYCEITDTAWAINLDKPLLELPDTIKLCFGVDSILEFDEHRVVFNVQETDTFRIRGDEISVYLENEQGCFDSKTTYITYAFPLNLNIGGSTNFCPDDTLIRFFNSSSMLDSVSVNNNSNAFDPIVIVTDTIINLHLSNACNAIDTSIVYSQLSGPEIELGEDREVCAFNNTIVLPPLYSYTWHDQKTDTVYSFYESGLHIAKAIDTLGCSFIDSVNILYKNIDTIPQIPDVRLCKGDQYRIFIIPEFDVYNWSDGIDTNLRFLNPGEYELDVSSYVNDTLCYNESFAFEVTEWDVSVPNVITPNGDGLNDDFIITGFTEDQSVTLEVYDRWGKRLVQNQTFSGRWTPDPSLESGVYFYETRSLDFNCLEFKGWITIIK